jgi:hypothetical protein
MIGVTVAEFFDFRQEFVLGKIIDVSKKSYSLDRSGTMVKSPFTDIF